MADADFGYVRGRPGKVNLYIGKTPVKFNIPEMANRRPPRRPHQGNGKCSTSSIPVAAPDFDTN